MIDFAKFSLIKKTIWQITQFQITKIKD